MRPEAEEQPRPVRMGVLHRPSQRSEQVDSNLRSLWAQACPAWGAQQPVLGSWLVHLHPWG